MKSPTASAAIGSHHLPKIGLPPNVFSSSKRPAKALSAKEATNQNAASAMPAFTVGKGGVPEFPPSTPAVTKSAISSQPTVIAHHVTAAALIPSVVESV